MQVLYSAHLLVFWNHTFSYLTTSICYEKCSRHTEKILSKHSEEITSAYTLECSGIYGWNFPTLTIRKMFILYDLSSLAAVSALCSIEKEKNVSCP